MSSNYQQGCVSTDGFRHSGVKPAGRVIDFRKKEKENSSRQTPQETIKITCGLCQFQFGRAAKPTLLILVCPSCGVRFEHHLPEPQSEPPKNHGEFLFSTPPKRLSTTLHQPLNQNLQQDFLAEAPEEEFPQINLPIPQVFAPIPAEEQDFDKEVPQSWSSHLQETPQKTQWIAALITITQTVLIAAALVALVSGMSSYFPGETKSTAKTAREIPGVSHKKSQSEALQEPTPIYPTKANTQEIVARPQSSPEPMKMDVEQCHLPSFDIDDLPILQSQQKPTVSEDNAKLVSVSPAIEEVEIDAVQEVQLQAKLAAKEKQLQVLLQEQRQIQTQSKKLVSETLLRESAITLEKNPTRSLFLSLQSIQILQELGLQVSDWGKTILAQAYATQSSGECYIEAIPSIQAQAISSSGKWLLTSHADQSLWLWDISKANRENRKELGFRIDVSPVRVIDLLLTPDEQWFVGARADGLVELWNMTVDRPSETTVVLREQVPGLARIQISPDGRWLVAYGQETQNQTRPQNSQPRVNHVDRNGIWIWDMNTCKQGGIPRAIVLRGHEGPIRRLAISNDSRWLATGSEDRSIRIFDLKSAYPGGNQKVLLGHQLEVTDLQFSPDGRWIATGSRDNTARIWDLQSETTTPTARILKGHNGWISSLAISADGKWFATAGYDQSVRLWNMLSILGGTSEKESLVIVPGQGTIQKVAFTPDSSGLVTYGTNQSLKIWNLTTESITDHVVEISRNTSNFSFGANGRWLILSSNQNSNQGTQTTVFLWPLKFEDMVQQATKFKETTLPSELHEREDAYAKQFEQRLVR